MGEWREYVNVECKSLASFSMKASEAEQERGIPIHDVSQARSGKFKWQKIFRAPRLHTVTSLASI